MGTSRVILPGVWRWVIGDPVLTQQCRLGSLIYEVR
jgi:hypothetical protein